MFLGDIIPFQTEHEQNLLRKCADYQEVVLYAPTGSGKTVLVSRFIDDYLDENPNTVFLWLCPGAGGLERQSQDTFEAVTSGILDGDVYSFINEPDPRGRVYFINWDKINKKSNVVLREGEHKDLMTKVLHCHNDSIDIFMIIDEEHKYRDTANEYVANIQPVHVLRISATPVTRVEAVEEVKDDEVIGAGLIATGISINEGLSKAIEENNQLDDDLQLLELADSKRKEIQAEYDKLGLKIRPLVLIQFPNGSDEWIDTSHWETRHRPKNIPVFNGRRVQSTTASIYPGYIFSQGDLDILMDSQLYFGTIVSGGDIKIKGVSQENVNSQERGLIIAHGDVTAELQKAALNQLSIQARNIEMNLAQDMLLSLIFERLEKIRDEISVINNITTSPSYFSTGLSVKYEIDISFDDVVVTKEKYDNYRKKVSEEKEKRRGDRCRF